MHCFDQDMAFAVSGSPVSRGSLSDNWSVNGTPNGGYIMALLAGAMIANSDRRSTPILTANYINRCVPGEAEIIVGKGLCLQPVQPAAGASPPGGQGARARPGNLR